MLPSLVMLVGVFFPEGELTLSMAATVFSHPRRLELLLTTLGVIAGTLIVALGLGVPAGFLCFRTAIPGRRWLALAALPAATVPLYVTTTAWITLLGSQFWFTLPTAIAKAVGVSWIQGVAYVPLVMLVSGIAFSIGQADAEELALLETGRFQVFRHVALPQALWGISAAAVTISVLAFTDITVTDTLAVRTYPEETFVQFELHASPWRGTATSLPIIVLLAGAGWLLWYHLRHHERWRTSRPPPLYPLPPAMRLLAMAFLGVLVGIFLVPLGSLAAGVGSWSNFANGVGAVYPELLFNLQVTPAAAVLAATVGFIWANLMVWRPRTRWYLGPMLILLMATPAPVVGMGLIHLFNHAGLPGMIYDSSLIVVLAHLIRSLPLAVIILLPALQAMPREWDEAALLDGAGWLQRLIHITTPACWRSVALAFALACILSLSEVGASVLVVPPGTTTVTVRFLSLIHWGAYSDVASLCLLMLAAVAIPALALTLLLRRWLLARLGE